MKYIICSLLLAPAFIHGMNAPIYPPTVITIDQKLVYDSYLGDCHLDRIRQFLNSGADANYREQSTPLVMAAYGAQMGTIELLLARGAKPNLENIDGKTPLVHALGASKDIRVRYDLGFRRQAIGSISRLVSAGADVNHLSVQSYLEKHPELEMVLKQAQEIAVSSGSQKME